MHANRLLVVSTFVLLTGCAAQPHRVEGVRPVHAQASDLAWIVGIWHPTVPGGPTEVWAEAEGGSLRGFSVSHEGDLVDEFELLTIEQNGRGLVYLARPNGIAPSTPFALVEVGPTSAVFANPQNDFPQRIGYERTGEGLSAWIEGPGQDGTRRISWTWR